MSKARERKALKHWARFGVVLASALLSTMSVAAQSPADRVNQMTAEAMEAYNGLDIDRAGTMLVEAIEFANQNGVSGPPVARANMNLGVVYVGGLGDNTNGLVHFLAAVCADPNIQLDPLTSTPDIQTVFQLAQQRAQGGGCSDAAAPPPGPGPVPDPGPSPGVDPGIDPVPAGDLIHTAPTQQRSQTPLPLYVEAPMPDVQKVVLYYKGLGMETFKRVDMVPYGAGYAYQLSCQDVWEPRITYYIEVKGDGGRTLASVGTAQAPIEVAVSSSATSAQLPDAAPPASCAADTECPPGVECATRGIAAIGEPCESSANCQGGLICSDDTCALAGAGAVEDDEDDGPASTDFARFFLQLGGTLGFALVQAGMIADSAPPGPRFIYADNGSGGFDTSRLRVGGPWVPDADSLNADGNPATDECPADGITTKLNDPMLPNEPSRYCVNVPKAGFVPNTAIRANIGYFLTSWLSAAAIVRYQLVHGVGVMAGLLVGGRLEALLTSPEATGLSLSLYLGSTFGQVQVKPAPTNAQQAAPYVRSGLNGAHLGSNIRYRFARNFGVFVAPEALVQIPDFLFVFDLTGGIELAL